MNLRNEGNSCFLDSLLVAMYGNSKSPFYKFLNPNDKLMNSIKTCIESNSSRNVRNCLPPHLRSGQHDPGETYLFLAREMNYEPMKITSVRQVKKINSETIYKKKSTNESSSCFTIENNGNEEISFLNVLEPEWETLSGDNYIHDSTNTPVYNRTRNLTFFTEAEILVFYFNRCQNVRQKFKNKLIMPFIFDASRTVQDKKREFFCFAIIVHMGNNSSGGHYVTFLFNGENNFYVYDDLSEPTVKQIEWNYQNKEFIERNGVMYFYYEK